MRLSTIFELLLILLLVAFAAYGHVIGRNEMSHRVVRDVDNARQSDTIGLSTMSLKQAADSVNRYCTCNENICNCCRDFHIPVVQLKGPGCASLQYLQGDNLAVQLSFGDNILTSTIVNGKSPRPVCVPLPGGFTKFCGRIYSIQRDARNHFKACLGLELQSATELEASLRVSCFRFGPDGLKLRPAEPLPVVEAESTEEEDDDDFFGLGTDDDDDDEEEEDETLSENSVPNASGVDDAQESDDDDDEDDILGFSALLDIFTGDDDTTKRPKLTTVAPLLEFTIPILPRPTTATPLEDHELSTFANNELENNDEELEDNTHEPGKAEEEENTALTENNTEESTVEGLDQVTQSSNKIAYLAKPDKDTANDVKKGVTGEKKKPTVTSTSVNAIHDPEKPVKKPIKGENNENEADDDDILDDDDDDDDEDSDDEDDEIDDDDDKDDEDENEEDEDKIEDEKHEEHDYDEDEKDLADLDDDDDEEEEAMISALMETGKSKKDKENAKNQTNTEENHSAEVLVRKRHPSGNRQSKITRF